MRAIKIASLEDVISMPLERQLWVLAFLVAIKIDCPDVFFVHHKGLWDTQFFYPMKFSNEPDVFHCPDITIYDLMETAVSITSIDRGYWWFLQRRCPEKEMIITLDGFAVYIRIVDASYKRKSYIHFKLYYEQSNELTLIASNILALFESHTQDQKSPE